MPSTDACGCATTRHTTEPLNPFAHEHFWAPSHSRSHSTDNGSVSRPVPQHTAGATAQRRCHSPAPVPQHCAGAAARTRSRSTEPVPQHSAGTRAQSQRSDGATTPQHSAALERCRLQLCSLAFSLRRAHAGCIPSKRVAAGRQLKRTPLRLSSLAKERREKTGGRTMPRCHDTTRPALSLKRLEKHALSQFRSAQIGFPESSVAKIAAPVGGPRSKWLLSKRGKKRPQAQGFEPEPVEPKFYPSKFSATRLSAPNQKRLEKKPRS